MNPPDVVGKTLARCGWCLDLPATTFVAATPTCSTCAELTPHGRVSRYLVTVHARIYGPKKEPT